MLLEDKKAVVYGGAGSVGRAVAHAFAREGASVFLAGRTRATLDEVAREIAGSGGTVETAQVDALDQRAVDEHADAVAAKAGGIDVSFNAIGHGDVQAAIAFHPLSPLTFALVIAIAAAALLQLAGFPLRPPWQSSRFWIAAAAIFACFGILRIILPIAGLTL